MEDLASNPYTCFTKWVASTNLLCDKFVVLDVGVQGGINIRWESLGDHLVVYGFDPIPEVIDELSKTALPNRHYFEIAIGDSNEEKTFYYNPLNPTSSSMYQQGPSRFDQAHSAETRNVKQRKLDTLYSEGLISLPDFVKVDVEGFEKSVLEGASELFSYGTVLGVEIETNFLSSPTYPKGHFWTISECLRPYFLRVFDIGFNRVQRASFTRALLKNHISQIAGHEFGSPATINALYCRDLIDNFDFFETYSVPPKSPSVDQIIKLMIVYELYALDDIAVDTAIQFQAVLGARLDVEKAIVLLCENTRLRTRFSRSPLMQLPIKALKASIHALERRSGVNLTKPLKATSTFVKRALSVGRG